MTPTPAQIRRARLAAGLTQRHAAELIGYSLRMWEEWESGRSPMRAVLWQAWNDSVKRNNAVMPRAEHLALHKAALRLNDPEVLRQVPSVLDQKDASARTKTRE
jgi:putative transcriptional regulator